MRTITVELVTPSNLRRDPIYGGRGQEDHAARGTGSFRPLTQKEWDRVERRVLRGRQVRRKPLGIHDAPRPRLADGRYVDDVLDGRA